MADTREELLSKPWFGFDLDDTLHEFRKASGAATTVALSHIATQHQILLKDLKATYKKVLARGTWNSFTDGRTSLQYRKERFANLLEMFYIVPTSEFLDILAARYKTALEQSLEINQGLLAC
jgi:putative hydrolase of the HAD superfamily